jgi:hypothetical protein
MKVRVIFDCLKTRLRERGVLAMASALPGLMVDLTTSSLASQLLHGNGWALDFHSNQ